MNYIKNNKVFIFLLTILLFIISILSYLILFPKTNSNPTRSSDNQSTTAQISTFYGSFNDDVLAVELSWNINTGNKKLTKLMLYCNDEELEDVTNSYSISLKQSIYGLNTGNNKFDLVATFSDGTELTKTKYVYTDEAFAIKIAQQNMESKSIYTITYYYDKRKPVNVPSVHMSGINENFTMNYVSSETVSEEGNMVNMKVVYELLYNDVKLGNYNVALSFVFSQYNITKNYTATFQVATQTNIEKPEENENTPYVETPSENQDQNENQGDQ